MDLTLLAKLRDDLLAAQEFKTITSFFMDHFGNDPAFMALGERTRDSFLEPVLEQICRQLFGERATLKNLSLTRLPEYRFIHGGFAVAGRIGNVLYFDDIHVGLLTLAMLFKSSDVQFIRFTARPLQTD